METSFFVYIIYSASLDRYYVGYSSDLTKQLGEHNSGMSVYTSKATDWVLKYKESFGDRAAAQMREKEIKRKKSRNYIDWLIETGTRG